MKVKIVAAALMVLAALLAVSPARAENQPHATLDAIATEAAGKPLAVWCESSVLDWDRMVYAVSRGQRIGAQSTGFTQLSAPIVYLAPDECGMLHFGLAHGYRETGLIPLVSAVLTLLHEATHQRGITDEGVTDCTALPLVVPMMVKHFRLTQQVSVTQTREVWRTLKRKIAGKVRSIRYSTREAFTAVVANPDYARASAWALWWHRDKAPAYQGTC